MIEESNDSIMWKRTISNEAGKKEIKAPASNPVAREL
jgi:hypothetical protein